MFWVNYKSVIVWEGVYVLGVAPQHSLRELMQLSDPCESTAQGIPRRARIQGHWSLSPDGRPPKTVSWTECSGRSKTGKRNYNNSDPRCGLERALLVMWFLWRQGERGRGEEREEGRGRKGERKREKKREYVQMLKKTQKNSNYRFNLDQSFSVSHHRFQRNITPSVCLMVKFLS